MSMCGITVLSHKYGHNDLTCIPYSDSDSQCDIMHVSFSLRPQLDYGKRSAAGDTEYTRHELTAIAFCEVMHCAYSTIMVRALD